MKRMIPRTVQAFVLILLIAFTVSGISASAVSELSPTRKAAFDKSIAKADPVLKNEIMVLFNHVNTAQRKELDLEDMIKTLYSRNAEALIELKARIKLIDADLIKQHEEKLRKKKDNYEPLFALYRTINKKDKGAQSMKIAVELARQDIRSGENLVKTAKSGAAAKKKQIGDSLKEIDKIRVRISLQKSKVSTAKKRFASEWTSFGTAIKKDEPKRMKTSLSTLVRHCEQIIEYKKTIHDYEKQISSVIAKASAQVQ